MGFSTSTVDNFLTLKINSCEEGHGVAIAFRNFI